VEAGGLPVEDTNLGLEGRILQTGSTAAKESGTRNQPPGNTSGDEGQKCVTPAFDGNRAPQGTKPRMTSFRVAMETH
jgi:hypothetical protein